MQPTQWRERGVVPRRALMPPIFRAYLEHIHQPGFQYPQVTEMNLHYLAGLMAPITDQLRVVKQLWSTLGRVMESLPLSDRKVNYCGLKTYPDGTPETAFYLAGFEDSQSDDITPLLVRQIIPAGKYIRLIHCGSTDTLPLTLDFLYHTWLPKVGLPPGYAIELLDFGSACPWVDTPLEMAVLLPI